MAWAKTGSLIAKVAQAIGLTAASDKWTSVTVNDDGTDSATWPNRLEFLFKPSGGSAHLTGYFNEYGELRAVPGKASTVPLRVFTKTAPGDAAHTANVIEVQDDRTTRTVIFAVDSTGKVIAPNVGVKVSTGASAPTSPATGDVWIH